MEQNSKKRLELNKETLNDMQLNDLKGGRVNKPGIGKDPSKAGPADRLCGPIVVENAL